MVLQSNTNSMEFKNKEIDLKRMGKTLLCIAVGTAVGLIVYGIFLYFKIAIFGWNLGLIFAPVAAGYAETILANRILGQNIGAISAFVLFIYTTFYSFILKNPTLGLNIITAGSILVILQAAFPTLINYILLVVIGGILSSLIKFIRKYGKKLKNIIKNQRTITWEPKPVEDNTTPLPLYDELESNFLLNSLDFYFITSSDMIDVKHEDLRMFHSEVIVENEKSILHPEPEKEEYLQMIRIKDGKDECLIRLATKIKNAGGNGILDLSINYSVIGLKGESIQITAMGMGVFIK